MKLLIISPTVYSQPPTGYSGTEWLCWALAEGLQKKGHQVSIVAPEGSRYSEGVELIPTPLREAEEQSWSRYRGRLEGGEWDVVVDATFERWSVMSIAGKDPERPVVQWHHTAPIYGSVPPVRYPLFVGVSQSHAEELSRAWSVPVRFVRNGIDLEFYKSTGAPRGNRYLAMGRYTPEKGFLEMVLLAKRLRTGLDLYGDLEIISSPDYARRCQQEADGMLVRANPGISRAATVDVYSTHHALLHLHRWNEPLSLVCLEAMSTGCPPIAMRRGGPSEIIKDGITGFLVDDDEQAAALIQRDAVKEINPSAMRQHVEEHFGLGRFVDDWEKLLQRIVGGERW